MKCAVSGAKRERMRSFARSTLKIATSERAVQTFPRKAELSRALRGIGFVYIEQRKLDKAEAIYKRCLELDPEDKTAQNELEYVRQLRGQTKV